MAKRRVSRKQRAAALRNLKKARAALRRKSNPARKRTKRVASRRRQGKTMQSVKRHGKSVSRAAWKRSGYSRNTPRRRSMAKRRSSGRRGRRRRGYRRNPSVARGFNVRGIMRQFQQGMVDAAGVVGGKAATRLLANMLPLPKEGAMANFLVQGVAASVVGLLAGNFLGKETARMMVAGGFAAPVETLMKGLPVIGPALGDDYLMGEYYEPMGELPIGEDGLPIGEYGEYVEYEAA